MTVVHSLDQARAAVAVATAPLALESPPAASASLGIGWWRNLLTAIAAEFPNRAVRGVLDCGDAPGHALAAIAAGVQTVRLQGPPELLDKIADIARQSGAEVVRVAAGTRRAPY
jgi:hypothetical protein